MQPRSRHRVMIFWALLFICPCLILGCQSENASEGEKKPIIDQVRPVKVYELKQQNSQKIRTFPGTARALQETNLSFRVSGPLVALDVETGRYFEKGAVVARVDPRDFEIRLSEIQARLTASKADYTEARLQFNRYKKLVSENAAAKATFDQVKAAYERAEAQVEANTKSLENAENALDDTTLAAPFSGYISEQFAENNEMIEAGHPIVSMVDLSAVEIKVAIPEDLMPAVNRFESYRCRFPSIPGKTFPAAFKEIGKQPNPSNQTYPLTLVIEESGQEDIRPGMAAEVSITIREENGKPVFIVPMSALVNGSDRQTFVWIVDPEAGRLKRQPVTVGSARANGFIEIYGEIRSGQLIASAGAHTLTADQKIRVMAAPSPTNIGNEL